MDNPLVPPIVLALIIMIALLLFVMSINPQRGGNVSFRNWYWRTFDLYEYAPQQSAQPQAPIPAQQGEAQARAAARPASNGNILRIKQAENGIFYARCAISADGGSFNGAAFEGIVDTGASICCISHAVARQIGISNPKELREDSTIEIAGGKKVPIALAEIDWNVGGIIVRNVKTSIMHIEENGGKNLIGASFLSQCRMKVEGDEMLLAPKK